MGFSFGLSGSLDPDRLSISQSGKRSGLMTPIVVDLLPQFQASISFLELAHVLPARNMLSW